MASLGVGSVSHGRSKWFCAKFLAEALLFFTLVSGMCLSSNGEDGDGAIEVPPFSYFVPIEKMINHPAYNSLMFYRDVLWDAEPICIEPPCVENVNDEEERYLIASYVGETTYIFPESSSSSPSALPSQSQSPHSTVSASSSPRSVTVPSSSSSPSMSSSPPPPLVNPYTLPPQSRYTVETSPPERPLQGHRGKQTLLDEEGRLSDAILRSEQEAIVFTLTTDIVLKRSLPSLRWLSHLTIRGACNRTGGLCIIDGSGRYPIFTQGSRIGCGLTLSNIIFQNSRGAVYQGGCTFEAMNCQFYDNVGYKVGTSPGGGALQLESGSPRFNISDCIFSNNSAVEAAGGAISYRGSEGGSIFNTVFRKNRAALAGGAVDLQNPDKFDCNNCSFIENSAGDYGGGLSLFRYTEPASTIKLIGGLFSGNKVVRGIGGAIFLGAPVDGVSCHATFLGNEAHIGNDLVVETQSIPGDVRFRFCPSAPGGVNVTDIITHEVTLETVQAIISSGCDGCPAQSAS